MDVGLTPLKEITTVMLIVVSMLDGGVAEWRLGGKTARVRSFDSCMLSSLFQTLTG